ncbi:hypothetical protein H4W19_01640 [Pseudoxanthomonas mexicana]|uniref:Uncharacterized protein n=2 Tax=Pseudoxanthomonas mexicana TaxID=128785 RepID=A0ABX6RDE3_PSEMX|nr:hypothetical protein H4W19_01640 [Pseudoxanthomonas mexicana]
MNWSPSTDCLSGVRSLIPVPLPLLMTQIAEELCALKIPHTHIAALLLELLLGAEDADITRPREQEQKKKVAKALLDALSKPAPLDSAIKRSWSDFDWDLWKAIVAWIQKNHPFTTHSALQEALMRVRSGQITSIQQLAEFFSEEAAPPAKNGLTQ